MESDVDAMVQAMELAEKLSDENLRVALDVLRLECRRRIKRAAQMAAMYLNVGDDIEMIKAGRKLPGGARGHVSEVRRSGRIGVHFDDHGFWSVDATLVRKIETAASDKDIDDGLKDLEEEMGK